MHHLHTSSLQRTLENIWYKNGKGKWFLLPFTLLYCLLNLIQHWKLTRRRSKIDIPVIIVGNISIGGTGKTPAVIYLIKRLKKAGYKPAVITRGYGGKSTKWPRLVTAQSDPKQVGDEAVLIAKRAAVPVVAGPERTVDIRYLRSKYDCDVIISDDGLQHYCLHRDIEIVLINAQRELGNGWCLPAGPLRENAHRLKNVDFVLYNDGFEQKNSKISAFSQRYQLSSVFSMQLSGDTLYSLFFNEKSMNLSDLLEEPIHAVTGIAHPDRFYKTLEKHGLNLTKHSFPDHYDFKPKDLEFYDDKIIIMTEKDAVKCSEFAHRNCWFLPVEAQMEDKFDDLLLDKLEKLSV
ncbi:MAG TPA: tetraacyldisaccharide 4'-kinase [Leucothrix mucor]|uniref:Tetraacyldisaccharide 4'-kinase n=1 Tax=Leucothrix mucor TaxID=45248 RepID=A0A7V2WU43_LEUMU|nr:tetraacyldisaccharide 4'-kinase [Leucothrix mucor]